MGPERRLCSTIVVMWAYCGLCMLSPRRSDRYNITDVTGIFGPSSRQQEGKGYIIVLVTLSFYFVRLSVVARVSKTSSRRTLSFSFVRVSVVARVQQNVMSSLLEMDAQEVIC